MKHVSSPKKRKRVRVQVTCLCGVYEGFASIKLCEGYIDFLHSQTPMRLPMDEAQYFEWLYGGMNDE